MDKFPRVCLSAGHGLGSRTPCKVDPGANVVGTPNDEAAVTLAQCKRLEADLQVLFRKYPGAYVMLRNGGYFANADDDAVKHGCDLFVEFHLNAGGNDAHGTEVLYRAQGDKSRAEKWSAALSKAIGTPNRGAKYRDNLAVLRDHPGMMSLLVEMWFASSKADRALWLKNRYKGELANLNQILEHYGWRKVKSLPRKWNAAQRAAYRR